MDIPTSSPATRYAQDFSLGSVLIFGAGGQLGRELTAQLGELAIPIQREECDVADRQQVRSLLQDSTPGHVVNAAAYTNVDGAETDRDQCDLVNREAAGILASECEAIGSKLVHISTDYVFGTDRDRNTPYTEEDIPGPLGYYAESKLAGEKLVLESSTGLVVRTCGLYNIPERVGKSRNFPNTILNAAKSRDELRVVDDQICTPSYVPDIAEMVLRLLSCDATGLYHLVNQGEASWYDVACQLISEANMPTKVTPIPSSEYPTAAQRPAYSVLSTQKYEALTGHSPRPWREAIQEYVSLLEMKVVRT